VELELVGGVVLCFFIKLDMGAGSLDHLEINLAPELSRLQHKLGFVLWTPLSFRVCLDSCLRIGLVSLYDPIQRFRFEYNMRGARRLDVRVAAAVVGTTQAEMRVIGSRGRISSHWICQRSIRNIQWLRRIS
jgi:hypothetical protein